MSIEHFKSRGRHGPSCEGDEGFLRECSRIGEALPPPEGGPGARMSVASKLNGFSFQVSIVNDLYVKLYLHSSSWAGSFLVRTAGRATHGVEAVRRVLERVTSYSSDHLRTMEALTTSLDMQVDLTERELTRILLAYVKTVPFVIRLRTRDEMDLLVTIEEVYQPAEVRPHFVALCDVLERVSLSGDHGVSAFWNEGEVSIQVLANASDYAEWQSHFAASPQARPDRVRQCEAAVEKALDELERAKAALERAREARDVDASAGAER